jgi:hypothetical protein
VIIEPRFSPDQRRQINDLPPAEVLAKDRVPNWLSQPILAWRARADADNEGMPYGPNLKDEFRRAAYAFG